MSQSNAKQRGHKTRAVIQRDRRNLAIAGGVVVMIVLIYLITYVRISGAASAGADSATPNAEAMETSDPNANDDSNGQE